MNLPEIRSDPTRNAHAVARNWLAVPPDFALSLPGGLGHVLEGLDDVVGAVLIVLGLVRRPNRNLLQNFFKLSQLRAYFASLLFSLSFLLLPL